MSRARKKQGPSRAATVNIVHTALSRGRWITTCVIVVLTLVIAGWWILPPNQSEVHLPPSLDALDWEEVDPAILESVRSARRNVLDDLSSPDKWGHLGLVFAAHGFNEKAADCFATASGLAPRNQRWAYLHAHCKVSSAPKEAMALLQQCADLPGDPLDTPRLVLVDKLLELQQLDEAERHLKRSLAKNARNTRAQFAKARLHFMREEYEACRNQILATHREVKDTYEAEVAKAKRLAEFGRHAEAKSIVDAAKKQLQSSLCQQKTIGTLLATTLMRLGDVDGGRKQQELANQQSDRRWPDPYTRGIAELKTGLRSMLSRSDVAYGQKRYSEALAILDRAVSRYPDSLFARIRLGRTRIRLGRMAQDMKDEKTALGHYEEAQIQLDAALSIDANAVEAHFRRGILALYWAGLVNDATRLSEAEQHFREAIRIKPDFAMAYYNLARCLDKQRKPIEAIAAMREALKFDPKYLPARRALGGLLMKAGRLREALVELERVVEIRPNDKEARGWIEMMRRDLGSP